MREAFHKIHLKPEIDTKPYTFYHEGNERKGENGNSYYEQRRWKEQGLL